LIFVEPILERQSEHQEILNLSGEPGRRPFLDTDQDARMGCPNLPYPRLLKPGVVEEPEVRPIVREKRQAVLGGRHDVPLVPRPVKAKLPASYRSMALRF
jgi:hypothetical protein